MLQKLTSMIHVTFSCKEESRISNTAMHLESKETLLSCYVVPQYLLTCTRCSIMHHVVFTKTEDV